MSHFDNIVCTKCGGDVHGLQITEEQMIWLNAIKDATLQHLINLEGMELSVQEEVDNKGWKAMAEATLFLYGYMISREGGSKQ